MNSAGLLDDMLEQRARVTQAQLQVVEAKQAVIQQQETMWTSYIRAFHGDLEAVNVRLTAIEGFLGQQNEPAADHRAEEVNVAAEPDEDVAIENPKPSRKRQPFEHDDESYLPSGAVSETDHEVAYDGPQSVEPDAKATWTSINDNISPTSEEGVAAALAGSAEQAAQTEESVSVPPGNQRVTVVLHRASAEATEQVPKAPAPAKRLKQTSRKRKRASEMDPADGPDSQKALVENEISAGKKNKRQQTSWRGWQVDERTDEEIAADRAERLRQETFRQQVHNDSPTAGRSLRSREVIPSYAAASRKRAKT